MSFLGNIPNDKLLHFFVGFVLSSAVIPLFGWKGLAFVFFVALAKEIVYDYLLKKGNCEIMDFIWTVVPAIVIYLLLI